MANERRLTRIDFEVLRYAVGRALQYEYSLLDALEAGTDEDRQKCQHDIDRLEQLAEKLK